MTEVRTEQAEMVVQNKQEDNVVMRLLFDVELAKQQEAQRRLAILGDYALKTLDTKQL